jgi:hypothetical protein
MKGKSGRRDIAAIRNDDGLSVTDGAAIAEVFASFYEKLYSNECLDVAGMPAQKEEPPALNADAVRAFDMDELKTGLSGLRNGKARDQSGILAEMLKLGHERLLELVLDVFNDVLLLRDVPPAAWKATKLVVIFKKGDPELPKNYRPIAILPILYKLFSRMLCTRLSKYVLLRQDVDQAAYRPGYGTEDHLLTMALLIEKAAEFRSPLWFALVDFEKAFDMVEHAALWGVLKRQGIPHHFIVLLQTLYTGQVACVQANSKSRDFLINRGVKQGDPISALLFIAVMQDLCEGLKLKWKLANKRRTGVPFGIDFSLDRNADTLTNLRFADDVIIIAQCQRDIKTMLNQFASRAAFYGLRINFDKTKILTFSDLASGMESIDIGSFAVEVLGAGASEKYLGRKLDMQDHNRAELRNRISSAWAAFHVHKSELCGKFYHIRDRAKLFDSVVTSTALYGCAAWAMTRTMCNELDTARRKMLRYVFRLHRNIKAGETWIEYMQRSAQQLDDLSSSLGLEPWSHLFRRRKWDFAGKVARRTDFRWSQRLILWRPLHAKGRDQGHPKTRWEDELVKFAGGDWMHVAQNVEHWNSLKEGFACGLF